MYNIIIKLLLSSFLGGLIGYEREKHGRPAGIRTHLLVCLGSALTMVVSLHLYDLFIAYHTTHYASGTDPSRIASMVMAGIGFLGAGVIVQKKGGDVWGLTTAACLWVTAALGLAVGCGLYLPSILVVVISISSLTILKRIEKSIDKDCYYNFTIYVNPIKKDILKKIVELFELKNAHIAKISFEQDLYNATYYMQVRAKDNINNYFVKHLLKIEGIDKVICD